MKRTFKKIMGAAGVIAMLYSCSKSETNQVDNANANAGLSTGKNYIELRGAATKWQAAANRLNPVDSIGLQHNLSLVYILQKTTYGQLRNADSVYIQSFGYGAQRFGAGPAAAFKPMFPVSRLTDLYRTLETGAPSATYLLDQTGLTGISRDYLNRIFTYLYNPNAADIPVETIRQQIVTWESGIGSLNITAKERTALYAFGSTARYSLYAWVDAMYPENEGDHVNLQRLRLWGIIATVACDAIGGTLGAIAAGPVGAVIAGGSFSAGAAVISHILGW